MEQTRKRIERSHPAARTAVSMLLGDPRAERFERPRSARDLHLLEENPFLGVDVRLEQLAEGGQPLPQA